MGRVLILGGSGRFGRNAAEAFWNASWRVTLFDRKTDDLTRAAQGVDVIVHGWNPVYTDWALDVPELTHQVIKAAQASGATVIIPGNVYVYGHDAPEEFGPHVPHKANNPLGQIRREMERAFREAKVPVILLRAGDFLDTEASGNWFDKILAPSLRKGVLTYPGAFDAPHAWAYLPDLCRAMVALAERREMLPQFSDIAFPGYTLTARDLIGLCEQVLDQKLRLKRMSWAPIHIARPFWPLAKHLLEMRYLWDKPHHLSADSFDALLPDFRPTDPVEALTRAITPVLNQGPDQPKPTGAAPHSPQTA
jgi:nucleoside-diphosphate-sugar epimerase